MIDNLNVSHDIIPWLATGVKNNVPKPETVERNRKNSVLIKRKKKLAKKSRKRNRSQN